MLAGGTVVMQLIPPDFLYSTVAPVFLIASIPACSALPVVSPVRVNRRTSTLATAVLPLQVSTWPIVPAVRVTLPPRSGWSSAAVTRSQADFAAGGATIGAAAASTRG